MRAPESSQFHHLLQVRCSAARPGGSGRRRRVIDSVDEYARQMAAREAIRKRNQMIIACHRRVVVIGLWLTCK